MRANESDLGLLKMAAEAIANYHDGFDSALGHEVWWLQEQSRFGAWDPLADDGDALRLAVRLDIELRFHVAAAVPSTTASCKGKDDLPIAREIWSNDKPAATRRAIVRAAAEIGKIAGANA